VNQKGPKIASEGRGNRPVFVGEILRLGPAKRGVSFFSPKIENRKNLRTTLKNDRGSTCESRGSGFRVCRLGSLGEVPGWAWWQMSMGAVAG
jgi:hypothetical protein